MRAYIDMSCILVYLSNVDEKLLHCQYYMLKIELFILRLLQIAFMRLYEFWPKWLYLDKFKISSDK